MHAWMPRSKCMVLAVGAVGISDRRWARGDGGKMSGLPHRPIWPHLGAHPHLAWIGAAKFVRGPEANAARAACIGDAVAAAAGAQS